jgi:hypothetical protein
VGDELFHVDGRADSRRDGQTDMTKLIVALGGFANAPKKKQLPTKKCPRKNIIRGLSLFGGGGVPFEPNSAKSEG